MAGATNRAFKAAGIPRGAQKEIRLVGGAGMTLRSAISLAQKHGIAIPQKAHDFLAKRDARNAQKKPAVDDGAERQKRDAARAEARAVYERGNAGAGERLAGMRSDIRRRIQDVRDAEGVLRGTKDHAASNARKTTPAAKGGRDKRKNERERDRTIESKVTNFPEVQRAAMQVKQARMRLQSALASRDATARARKQQRGAESGGQMDLFSGAPKPQGQTQAASAAAAAAAPRASAPKPSPRLTRSLGTASRAMMAARKAGPTPKQLIEAAEKKHGSGISVGWFRDSARRALVDAGTARAKRDAAIKKAESIEAETRTNRGGRSAYDAGMRRAAQYRFEAQRASEAMARHAKTAKDSLRTARKIEAELPPQVRATIKPKRDRTPISSGASPEARAKMASAKARIEELRAARGERLKRQIRRAEAVRVATESVMRDQAARTNNVMPVRGPDVERYNRATRSLNRAAASARAQFGDRSDFVVNAARSSGKIRGKDIARAKRGNA